MLNLTKQCEYCKKEYQARCASHFKTSKYCSRSCTSKANPKQKDPSKWKFHNCQTCGKQLHLPSWRSNVKYCSHVCRNKSPTKMNRSGKNHWGYKEGVGSYRRWALKHYENKCMKCGIDKNLDVHHKDGNRKNNEVSNLEILCKPCHRKEHKAQDSILIGMILRAKREGKLETILKRVEELYEK